MKRAIKAKWIRALRSGKYQQGHGRLRTQRSAMCCLGVLCDITNPDGWQREGRAWTHGSNESMPSSELMRRLGVTGTATTTLASMNDGSREDKVKRHSFAEIAAWIKANL